MKKVKAKKIPKFKSYEEEANFWDTHDVTNYFSDAKDVNLNFKLEKSKEDVLTVRLQPSLKLRLTRIADEMGTGASTLARMWLVEKLRLLDKSQTQ
ncbi:hypothetical protein A3D00_05510 [Candidatus Woesebacteria bacterium RIFCSPHIGHO2_02_FULL_38_9]|uniref:Uncharacterized protein n=1 Tax=Candidatus Woesebacteria bacterium RIFCSPHIGHO2_01_FULL_39_28 TaxID=1802496 RepID=A0A1F7YIX3_9BACT|nr:MAG: hypothetical protein A2627_05890 [Candidatus Woesebacteria bacterium RIFCSPHIGHO2_01_FULL_39_28]OGM32012.1 MAG: hypothetical protein A3D00_05510 [Candidatus Woesebacteria bacterium RIFCSPHIGHO2_02_FULL_38_9]OGM57119.1 MAG: hypothetical protein A3A50_00300 [Candidatus Woesebacteria bacterium RIFCSPLOWO2_01_FULL_38_20]